MNEKDLPGFQGKIGIFYLANASHAVQDGVVLEYPTLKAYGDKLFVVGRIPLIEGNENWVSNLQSGIAWESVCHYIIFDSREAYQSRIGSAKIPLLQRIFGR